MPDKVLSLQGCKVNEKRLMMTSAGAGSTAIDHCFQIITQGQETIFLRTGMMREERRGGRKR